MGSYAIVKAGDKIKIVKMNGVDRYINRIGKVTEIHHSRLDGRVALFGGWGELPVCENLGDEFEIIKEET